MLQIQQPLCPELTFRLAHDISPDNYPTDDLDDTDVVLQREKFLLDCLNQATTNINNNNSITHLTQTVCDQTCDKTEKITETFAKLKWKEEQLEKINNEINKNHLTKEDHNDHINFINNNYIQSPLSSPDSWDQDQPRHGSSSGSHGNKTPRRPRKLPDIPKKNNPAPVQGPGSKEPNEKCLADELQEALIKSVHQSDSDDDVFLPNSKPSLPKVYPKFSCKFLEELVQIKFNSVSKNTRAYLNSDNLYLKEDSSEVTSTAKRRESTTDSGADRVESSANACGGGKEFVTASCGVRRVSSTASCGGRREDDGEGSRRKSSSCFPGTSYSDLEVTHRGMHRFIPRHADELAIEIGDPLHVIKTGDDLWCEGVNLETCKKGIFPSMYATDLHFLEEEEEEDGCAKFYLRFLGSVEVNYHKGDEVLCQAINKVALSRRAMKSSNPPPLCNLQVNQYGIQMFDKSKEGHENLDTFTHFFALKNISFCGYHPRNERYFGFITKHPDQYRYACHVFLGEKSTRSVSEALGQAFKRFYQEYMAFTHPTEDIYME